MNVRKLVGNQLEKAITEITSEYSPAMVVPASRPEFGDYQANGIMAAAKKLNKKPRDIASLVIEKAELHGIVEKAEGAGPGFINLFLNRNFLSECLSSATLVTPLNRTQKIVVDYSSPNLAKEMHVGHLRSAIIGDAVVRTLESLGHEVVRQNHTGDWGTPFGKLIAYFDQSGADYNGLADLEKFYIEANHKFNTDDNFAEASRKAVVKLHTGDPETLTTWKKFIGASVNHMQKVYERIGISLEPNHIRGESSYNEDLPGILEDLNAEGLLTTSDGAKCVFLDEFKGKDNKPLPVLVQKSDGGFLYHTTDLAAVKYRSGILNADRILYFTDARQNLHFKMLFAVARAAQFVEEDTALEHHPFGKIVDGNGKPFSTRDGGTIPLMKLIDEALVRARATVLMRNRGLTIDKIDEVVSAVAVGAIKYADLSKNRTNDYVFDWDNMLSFEGNTSPYIQYGFARIMSLFSKGNARADHRAAITIRNDIEHALAVQLVRYQETLEQVATEAMPHYLCGYLYELTTLFMRFYEKCPVLEEPTAIRESRLTLCSKTAATLKHGLNLLGISTVSQM